MWSWEGMRPSILKLVVSVIDGLLVWVWRRLPKDEVAIVDPRRRGGWMMARQNERGQATLLAVVGVLVLFPGSACRAGKPVILEAHKGRVYCVQFSPDGKVLASAGADGTIQLWDVAAGNHIAAIHDEPNEINHVSFAPDGKTLLACSNRLGKPEKWKGALKVWDIKTQRLCQTIPLGAPAWIAVAGDGRTVAVTDALCPPNRELKGDIDIWDLKEGRRIRTISGDNGQVYRLALSRDGKWLAARVDSGVHVWEMPSGKPVKAFADLKLAGPDWSLAFAPDGRSLATGKRGRAHILEVPSGKVLRVLPAEGDLLAYSGDGQWLVATDEGRRNLCVVEAASGTLLQEIDNDARDVLGLAFSPDGHWVATCGSDWKLRGTFSDGVISWVVGGQLRGAQLQ
jgi:WD40 repeat protein